MTLQLRPTFSESWYRVQGLRMKLRVGAQISRQFYRGERWYVVRDPAGNQFHRLSDPAYRFVALLDGSRTVEEAWDLCGGQLEDDAPTQPEVIQILSHLYSANLIDADITPDAGILLRRHKQQSKRKMQGRMMNMLFPRIPLWDPDRFLRAWMPVCKFAFSKFGALVWLLVVISATACVLPKLNDPNHSLKTAASNSIDVRNNPVNLVLLYGTFVVIKFLHELGHAFSTRRFGGECHELGIMFLVFIPTPYVDASTAWAFPNKWHRIFVGAGGMIVELFVAALAGFVWLAIGDIHSLLAQLAFNAMLIASVTTLVFNANPLLRYDGYYILSDYLEIPNLRQKSTEYTMGLIKRHLFTVKLTQPLPPVLQRFWLFAYAVSSSIYRAFVGFVILLIVAYELPVIGPLMAISGIATWFLVPCFKVLKYLGTDPELHRKRPRAVAITLGAAALASVILGFVRFPLNIDTEGVASVDPRYARLMFVDQPGFVSQIGKNDAGAVLQDGDTVHKGQVLMVLENRPLSTDLAVKDAVVAQYTVERDATSAVDPSLYQVKVQQLEQAIKSRDVLRDQVDRLTIRAPFDGQLIAPDIGNMLGQYLSPSRREVLRVEDQSQQYVEASLPQDDYQLLESEETRMKAEVRMVGTMWHISPAMGIRLVHSATNVMISPALTPIGGGASALDSSDRNQRTLAAPEFRARVTLDDAGNYVPGQRAYVRFKLAKRPLVWQWGRKAWQLIESRGASAKWL